VKAAINHLFYTICVWRITQVSPYLSSFSWTTQSHVVINLSLLFTNEYTSDCLKNNIKIYIKIAPTCFGAVTPSSGNSLSVLAKDTLC